MSRGRRRGRRMDNFQGKTEGKEGEDGNHRRLFFAGGSSFCCSNSCAGCGRCSLIKSSLDSCSISPSFRSSNLSFPFLFFFILPLLPLLLHLIPLPLLLLIMIMKNKSLLRKKKNDKKKRKRRERKEQGKEERKKDGQFPGEKGRGRKERTAHATNIPTH